MFGRGHGAAKSCVLSVCGRRTDVNRASFPDKPLIDADGEVRELAAEDLAFFKPSSEIPELAEVIRRGRPVLDDADRKQRVTMYLDRDLIERLKQDGKGWQTRANAMLRKAAGL